MKRVLMIVYHFPLLAGSSGIQRTLRFTRYLPEYGWQLIVLTTHPRAYRMTSDDQVGEIRPDVEVIRAPSWDTSRHFCIAGRYPGVLAAPGKWLSWWPGAVWLEMRAIHRLQPDALWSTYPVAIAPLDKAEAIANLLARFVANPRQGTVPDAAAVSRASRRERTRELAGLLNRASA